MDQTTSEAVSQQSAWADRRRALMAMGGAGLLAAFAGRSSAEAKKNKNKKSKKKCNKKIKKQCNQAKEQCTADVQSTCLQFGQAAPNCEALFLPCCATCNVGEGVTCVVALLVP